MPVVLSTTPHYPPGWRLFVLNLEVLFTGYVVQENPRNPNYQGSGGWANIWVYCPGDNPSYSFTDRIEGNRRYQTLWLKGDVPPNPLIDPGWVKAKESSNGVGVTIPLIRNPSVYGYHAGVGQCPENTCTVDCGDHYCCYDSNGYSVFNYDK